MASWLFGWGSSKKADAQLTHEEQSKVPLLRAPPAELEDDGTNNTEVLYSMTDLTDTVSVTMSGFQNLEQLSPSPQQQQQHGARDRSKSLATSDICDDSTIRDRILLTTAEGLSQNAAAFKMMMEQTQEQQQQQQQKQLSAGGDDDGLSVSTVSTVPQTFHTKTKTLETEPSATTARQIERARDGQFSPIPEKKTPELPVPVKMEDKTVPEPQDKESLDSKPTDVDYKVYACRLCQAPHPKDSDCLYCYKDRQGINDLLQHGDPICVADLLDAAEGDIFEIDYVLTMSLILASRYPKEFTAQKNVFSKEGKDARNTKRLHCYIQDIKTNASRNLHLVAVDNKHTEKDGSSSEMLYQMVWIGIAFRELVDGEPAGKSCYLALHTPGARLFYDTDNTLSAWPVKQETDQERRLKREAFVMQHVKMLELWNKHGVVTGVKRIFRAPRVLSSESATEEEDRAETESAPPDECYIPQILSCDERERIDKTRPQSS